MNKSIRKMLVNQKSSSRVMPVWLAEIISKNPSPFCKDVWGYADCSAGAKCTTATVRSGVATARFWPWWIPDLPLSGQRRDQPSPSRRFNLRSLNTNSLLVESRGDRELMERKTQEISALLELQNS